MDTKWGILRCFVGEIMSAFIANFPIMFHDHFTHYESFVGAIVAGCAVYCSIFVCFPVSGAQINPMTTLAVVLTRRMSLRYLPMYWVAQLIGTFAALSLGRSLSPFVTNRSELGMAMPGHGVTDNQAFVMEIIITFVMEIGILALLDELRMPSFHPSNKMNAFILLVAIFLMIDSMAAPISGACTNPARSIASALINLSFKRQWIFLIGPLIGTLLAVSLYEFIICPDACFLRTQALFLPASFDRNKTYSAINKNQISASV